LAYFAVKNPGILRTANHANYTNPESFRGNQSYCAESKNCGMKIFDKMSDSDGVQCKDPTLAQGRSAPRGGCEFGCDREGWAAVPKLTQVSFVSLFRSVRARETVSAINFRWHPCVLWLACRV